MDLVDRSLQMGLMQQHRMFKKTTKKGKKMLTCHLALAAHGAVDVAACLPMAMEQLHYLLVNSSVRRSLCNA